MNLETSAEHNTSSLDSSNDTRLRLHQIEATEKFVQLLSQHRQLHLLVLRTETRSMLLYRVPSNATLEMLLELMKTENTVHKQNILLGSMWTSGPPRNNKHVSNNQSINLCFI